VGRAFDISSDEETEQRRRDEEGKESGPPLGDISQTSGRLPTASPFPSHDGVSEMKARMKSQRWRKEIEEVAIEIDRTPLGDLEAQEFYAEGCTSSDVVLIADEEGKFGKAPAESAEPHEADPQSYDPIPQEPSSHTFSFSIPAPASLDDVDALIAKSDTEVPTGAKLLSPWRKPRRGLRFGRVRVLRVRARRRKFYRLGERVVL
jgi:hypothetical protein